MVSGICQNGKWHLPEWKHWKVAYAKMESGIYQNGKWHMPNWKVAFTRMVSGICQIGKWHIPEWKVAYTSVAYYSKFMCEIYLCFSCIIDIASLIFLQVSGRLRAAEAELRHKLFLPNAWMKVLHFNVFGAPRAPRISFINGLLDFTPQAYGEHIIPLAAIVHRYTQGITQGQPCLLV
jgi:hypothetical protein